MVAFCRARLRAKSPFSSNICEGVGWICEYSSGGCQHRLLRAPVRHDTLNTLLVALLLEYSNIPLPHRFSTKRETARSVQGILTSFHNRRHIHGMAGKLANNLSVFVDTYIM